MLLLGHCTWLAFCLTHWQLILGCFSFCSWPVDIGMSQSFVFVLFFFSHRSMLISSSLITLKTIPMPMTTKFSKSLGHIFLLMYLYTHISSCLFHISTWLCNRHQKCDMRKNFKIPNILSQISSLIFPYSLDICFTSILPVIKAETLGAILISFLSHTFDIKSIRKWWWLYLQNIFSTVNFFVWTTAIFCLDTELLF